MTQSPVSSSGKKLEKLSTALVSPDYFSPFGNKLIQSGYIDKDQLKNALVEVRNSKQPLVKVLESMTHKALSPDLVRQYKKHHLFELKILYGVDSVDPDADEISSDQMTELIDSVINIKVCRRHKLLPVRRINTEDPPVLVIAMVDPDNLAALDEVRKLIRLKGLDLQRIVITEEDYDRLIQIYYKEESEKRQKEEALQAKKAQEKLANVDDVIDDLNYDSLEEGKDESNDADLSSNDANQAPIIKLVNKVMIKALQESVSDIHIEPQEELLRVRMRKDGVLQEFFRLPRHITTAVVARFKIMAELDIAERRLPQDGKIRRVYQGRNVDFRVNTLPSRYGEKVCLRILDNSATQLGLDFLISDEETLLRVREIASRPFGLILVTGPTGSGKSTTLYSVLAERNKPGVNINTAEDPIEYALPGITQVQVIREKGMNFASILRAFMRQDPDIILVGETRDVETAKTAIEAALTGHLVLTTLHTNDAAGAIARLDEMGVEPFMISGALLGVLAQRLMRRVCTQCREEYAPDKEELSRFGLTASGEQSVTFYKARTLTGDTLQEAVNNGTVCSKCGGSGYKGRVGVYEFMVITETLQKLINKGATTDLIKETAVEEGMTTILAYSLNLVRQGHTTLEEVERVTFTDSGLESELKSKRKSSLTCQTCGAELQQEWMDCPYCMTPRFSD
ncbi:GspE/PulE family protein [Cyanobacterium sp. IPPAS B-1200]|uniref:GspE/PulE family protein n=1 Tax=Cyanobacterium sp. IPPAS B-1200 TaxID=1562720 RepID=UPI0008525410|nr:GspE/PulE family protein [Cyanobacterium sp. IPPAS B-1200]OEJ78032.1 general secretion pathway protein GspE [Cyanobacterium sp. IPPAS B-1200]